VVRKIAPATKSKPCRVRLTPSSSDDRKSRCFGRAKAGGPPQLRQVNWRSAACRGEQGVIPSGQGRRRAIDAGTKQCMVAVKLAVHDVPFFGERPLRRVNSVSAKRINRSCVIVIRHSKHKTDGDKNRSRFHHANLPGVASTPSTVILPCLLSPYFFVSVSLLKTASGWSAPTAWPNAIEMGNGTFSDNFVGPRQE
jgi:hypothetical protein